MYKVIFKVLLDFIFALMAIIILLPILAILTIVLFFVNSGKPFFLQERPGKDEKIFKIIKFKTMTDKKDNNGHLLPDKDRMTKLGSFVRKTSLDEIPQLINVLKGDMSFVGPRPLRTAYLELYSDYQKRRHEVKPGITGWAQVNGRNTISWTKKFEYDVWYVDNVTMFVDIKIALLTIKKVFMAQDINADKDITMQKFDGKN